MKEKRNVVYYCNRCKRATCVLRGGKCPCCNRSDALERIEN